MSLSMNPKFVTPHYYHSAHAYDFFQQVNTQAAEQGNLNVLFI